MVDIPKTQNPVRCPIALQEFAILRPSFQALMGFKKAEAGIDAIGHPGPPEKQ